MLFYRLIFSAMLPLLLWRGRDTWKARLLGPKVDGRRVWLHGASVGELNAAKPVIAGMTAHPLLVTCNTATGLQTIESWGFDHVQAALAPLDRASVARRMMGQVEALIVLENELWPNRIIAAHRVGVPVILLSARMSEGSARMWRRFSALVGEILRPVALAVPQDVDSGDRLMSLGLDPAALAPPVQLKAAYEPQTRTGHPSFDPGRTVLAASTHEGEEDIVLAAFALALRTDPALRLILAPRHPARAETIAGAITKAGLTMTRESIGEVPAAQVHLADTLGMMDTWYASAGACFVGGSLQDHGGHTPYEPLAHDLPILHGPHVANFADVYATLDQAGGAQQVSDAKSLADGFLALLCDQTMPDRARDALHPPDISSLVVAITNAITSAPQAR